MRTDSFEVELDELYQAGSSMLGASDDIAAIARAGILLGARAYGPGPLAAAADRFAVRLTHAVEGLGLESEDGGEDLRASAREYEHTDRLAPALLPTLDVPVGSSPA